MKERVLLTVGIATLTLFVFGTVILRAQDLAKVAPQKCKIVMENDRVRVLDLVYKPGEIIPVHSHPASAVVYLTPCKSKFQPKAEAVDIDAGTVRWSPGVIHINENMGKTDCHVIIIELKTEGEVWYGPPPGAKK